MIFITGFLLEIEVEEGACDSFIWECDTIFYSGYGPDKK